MLPAGPGFVIKVPRYDERNVKGYYGMILTKQEFSRMEVTIKFLNIRNMDEYCKYFMLKVEEAHSCDRQDITHTQ